MRIIVNVDVYTLISENKIPSSLLEIYNGNLTLKFRDLVQQNYMTILDVLGGTEYVPESTEKLHSYFELSLIRSKLSKTLQRYIQEIFEHIVKSKKMGYYEILALEPSNNRGLLLSLSKNKKTSWLLWETPVFKIKITNYFDLGFGRNPIKF